MWLLELLFGGNKNVNNNSEQSDKGDYSSWNFEEEDLEEDDYYFEDDD